jgi:hypothetical protein
MYIIGEYEDNRPSGWGIYTHTNGAKYEAIWNGRRQEYVGFEIWPDYTIYRGEYVRGRKNGIGMYKWPDGTVYEGDWINNTITGYV